MASLIAAGGSLLSGAGALASALNPPKLKLDSSGASLSGFDFGDGSYFGEFAVGGGSPSYVQTSANYGPALGYGKSGADNLTPVIMAALGVALILLMTRK